MMNRRSGLTATTFLPDFCSLRMVLVVVLLSQGLALLLELASPLSQRDFLSEFGIKSLFVLWVALPGAAVLCLLRRLLARLGNVATGLVAFALLQGVTCSVSWLALDYLPAQGVVVIPEPVSRSAFYLRAFGISAIVSAALLRYLYIQHQWKRQVKAEAEARLEVLQMRMRPHFLFNSLNTIASLARVDGRLAEELVQDLAELLRASLSVGADRLVSMAGEIALARQYLNIERQRLGPRLRMTWKVERLPMDALLPPLTLQPLVENAVFHGVEPDPGGGRVVISGTCNQRAVVLTVENSLPGSPGGGRRGNRIALTTLRARLDACFGDARVEVETDGGLYRVRLVFPYLKEAP